MHSNSFLRLFFQFCFTVFLRSTASHLRRWNMVATSDVSMWWIWYYKETSTAPLGCVRLFYYVCVYYHSGFRRCICFVQISSFIGVSLELSEQVDTSSVCLLLFICSSHTIEHSRQRESFLGRFLGSRLIMDELTAALASSFEVSSDLNKISAPHPRFSQFKMKSSSQDQDSRRQRLLEFQKRQVI